MSRRYLETIRADDGKLFHLAYHQARLNTTLGESGVHKLSEILVAPKEGLFRCRVSYNAVDIRVEYIPYLKREIKRLKIIEADRLEYARKYEAREDLNALFKKRENCDDICIIKNGLLCDTTIANIALFDGERWVTPKTPLLEGTTRARYLDEGKIFPKDIALSELFRYKKMALMNAMIDFDIIAAENIEDIMC